MFLRLLFVFLITLNIAVGAWLLLGQDESLGRSATDPGVPELHLLSEQAPVAPPVGAASAAPAKPMAPSASYACMTLGPFATPQDLRSARGLLARELVRARARQEQTTELRGWWVHLPASGTRTQALAEARKLQAKHITDYFVVGSGDQQNTVSLGLFKDPANAHKRLEQVAAAGFPAQLTERSEQVPQYWLDLVVADSAHFDWRSRIPDPGVGSHSSACF